MARSSSSIGLAAAMSSCARAIRAFEPIEHLRLAGVSRDEMDGVNRADLADAIDAADSLLEPHRIPRQLEIDDAAGSGGAGSTPRQPRRSPAEFGTVPLKKSSSAARRSSRVRPPCSISTG